MNRSTKNEWQQKAQAHMVFLNENVTVGEDNRSFFSCFQDMTDLAFSEKPWACCVRAAYNTELNVTMKPTQQLLLSALTLV